MIRRMKIRDKVNMRWEHVQNHRIVTDEDKRIGCCKEAVMFLCELFRAGRIDKIGEPLFRGGILVDDAVFRFFVGVFTPPVCLEKAVKKREKGCGGCAWEGAPFGARERIHVDPFTNRGEQEERENVGSCANVYGWWGHFVSPHPSLVEIALYFSIHSVET